MREITKQLVELYLLMYFIIIYCLYICDFVIDETLRGKGMGQAFLKKSNFGQKIEDMKN